MSVSKYARKFGKLVRKVDVVLDDDHFQKIDEAKRKGFIYQDWARDQFLKGFHEIEEFLESKQNVKHA
jgi:hypothetical protein